jgi:hypothetical protein
MSSGGKMKVDSYKCDQCGKVKGEVNCWWTYHSGGVGFYLIPFASATEADLQASYARHLCGRACVQRELEAFMEEKHELSAVEA